MVMIIKKKSEQYICIYIILDYNKKNATNLIIANYLKHWRLISNIIIAFCMSEWMLWQIVSNEFV